MMNPVKTPNIILMLKQTRWVFCENMVSFASAVGAKAKMDAKRVKKVEETVDYF